MTEDTQRKNVLGALTEALNASKPKPKDNLGLLSPNLSEGSDHPPFFGVPFGPLPKSASSADFGAMRLEVERLTDELSKTRSALNIKCPVLTVIKNYRYGVAIGVASSGWVVAVLTILRYMLFK